MRWQITQTTDVKFKVMKAMVRTAIIYLLKIKHTSPHSKIASLLV